MPASERLLVHLPGVEREPVVEPREGREADQPHHDVVEVTDHVVGGVEREVDGHRREEHTRHAADDEVRDRPDTEQHRRGESDVTAPHRGDPVEGLDGARDRDGERDRHEARAEPGVDTRREHVVGPHAEREHADRERRVDDELVAEEFSPTKFRDDEAQQPHRWERQNVDLGVAEEPEEVLPEDRAAADEEGRPEVPVEQEHDERAPEHGEREEDQAGLGQDGPAEDVEVRPAHVLAAFGEDGGDEVDRAHRGGDPREVEAEQHVVDPEPGGAGLGTAPDARRERGVHRPGGLGGLDVGEGHHDEPTPDQEGRGREHPEGDGVEPRERHVVRADQERDEVVPEREDDRRPEQEQHRDAVAGEHRVVELRPDDRLARREEFGPHQRHHQPGDHEHNDCEDAVEDTDILVIYGGEPPDQPARLLV